MYNISVIHIILVLESHVLPTSNFSTISGVNYLTFSCDNICKYKRQRQRKWYRHICNCTNIFSYAPRTTAGAESEVNYFMRFLSMIWKLIYVKLNELYLVNDILAIIGKGDHMTTNSRSEQRTIMSIPMPMIITHRTRILVVL